MQNVLPTVVATTVSVMALPVLLYVWFAGIVVFSSAFILDDGWVRASWWKPFGYYGVGVLYVVWGAFLIAADIYAGIRLRRVFARQHEGLETLG